MKACDIRPRVLAAIQKPMTVAQVQKALPDLPKDKIENALHNAKKRGRATNLRSEVGRKCGGLWVAEQQSGPPAWSREQFAPLLEAWR